MIDSIRKAYFLMLTEQTQDIPGSVVDYSPSDAKQLLNIDKHSYKFPFNTSTSFNSHGASTKVYKSGDKVHGYIMAYDIGSHNSPTKYINSIAVHPDSRGKNISDELLNSLKDSTLHLHVRVGNAKAIALYHKHGFKIAETIPEHYSNGEDAHYMILNK